MRKNEALVLVSEAVRREDIDAGEARARLERARADLERAESGDGDVFRAKREADVRRGAGRRRRGLSPGAPNNTAWHTRYGSEFSAPSVIRG